MDLLKQTQAYQRLSSFGKAALLYGKLNVLDMKEKIKIHEKHFKYYNKRKPGYNRYGLSLTSRDGNFSGLGLRFFMLKSKNHFKRRADLTQWQREAALRQNACLIFRADFYM